MVSEPDCPSVAAPAATRFYGWRVVAACFLIALFGWGLGFYGPGIYLARLQAQHGWSVSLISAATTVYYLAGAALVVFLPEAMARLGQRATVLLGMAAMAAGVGALPLIAAPWQLFAAYLVMAVGWTAMSSTAITTILAPWFVRRRGLAISLAFNGASCGGVVIAPALVLLIERLGFPGALGTIIAVMLLVLAPVVVLVLRWDRPEALGLLADGATAARGGPAAAAPRAASRRSEALLSWRFWGVALPFALGLMAQVGFLTHQVAFLTPHLGAAGAGFAVALTTAAAVGGRLSLGLVVDRLDQRRVTAASFLSQAAALTVMIAWPGHAAALALGCAAFGFSVGNVITLPALIVQREFPVHAFGTVIALSTAVGQVTFAFGPGLLGLVRDAAGGYGAALALCGVLEAVAAGVILRRPGED